jgi:hypothetical protein
MTSEQEQEQKTYHFKNSSAFMMASFHDDEDKFWVWFSFLAEKSETLPVIYRKEQFPDLLKRYKWVLTNNYDSLKLKLLK